MQGEHPHKSGEQSPAPESWLDGQQAGSPVLPETRQWGTDVRSPTETVLLCKANWAGPAGLSCTDPWRAPKKSRTVSREGAGLSNRGCREKDITHKSWQPAQIISSLNCIPTHSPTYGEGTKCPQGLWLGEAHMEMVGLGTVHTL